MLESTDGLIRCTLTKDGQVINENISDLLDNTFGNYYYQVGPFAKLPPIGIEFEALILNSDNPRVWQKNSSLKTTPKVGSRPRCGCDTVVEVSLSDPTVRSSNPTLKYSFQRIKVSLKFLSPE